MPVSHRQFVLTGCQFVGLPPLTAIAVRDGIIDWIGPQELAVEQCLPEIDLSASANLVTPAFVDAHAHLLYAGRALDGLELSDVGSVAQLLDRVAERCRRHPGVLIAGQGWDHTDWPEGRPPTRAELDRAAPGTPVVLVRVEFHSAVVSSTVLERVPAIVDADGYDQAGWITRESFRIAETALGTMFTDTQRHHHVALGMRSAAAQGIAAVHEMATPTLGPLSDLTTVIDDARDFGLHVHPYWGELAGDESLGLVEEHGLAGLAGDLSLDGAIGARTASVTGGYDDDHHSTGYLYLDAETVTGHVIECTRRGVQAGFHCIGDGAITVAARAIADAAAVVGADRVRACRHRLEHVEMCDDEAASLLAEFGVWASLQPLFDAWWGGPGGLYDQRLGDRRLGMNRFATLQHLGVPLAFGSDAPVTPFGGWEVVRAAMFPWQRTQALGMADAFAATSRDAHRCVGVPDSGRLEVGARADLAVWECPEVAGGWPVLEPGIPAPRCVATVASGRAIHDPRALFGEAIGVPG